MKKKSGRTDKVKEENMWKKIDTYVEKYAMIWPGESVVAGLSGGADSVCLLRYLLSVRERKGINLYAVHVNHQLREGEADRDQRFTEEFCREWEIPLRIFTKDVAAESKKQRCSLEEAGRSVRYRCFAEAAAQWNCDKIAVAHHKNDLAETMLFRMARGTGLRGLTGIKPKNGKIIRPLLCLNREEILKKLERLSQDYVEDSTNEDTEYRRNYIRRHVIPEMEEVNVRAVEHMSRISEETMEMMAYLEPVFSGQYRQYVRRDAEGYYLETERFLALPQLIRREIVRRMLFAAAGKQKDISAVHVEQMMSLAEKPEGKYIRLPYGMVAVRAAEGLRLLDAVHGSGYEKEQREKEKKQAASSFYVSVDKEELEKRGSWEMDVGENLHFIFRLKELKGGCLEKSDCVKYFDYDKIKSTLCIRNRQSGDYFIMDREGRQKMLRRYFIDEKIPAGERAKKILLAEEAHVLWMIGGRVSEAGKVSSGTKRMLEVKVETTHTQDEWRRNNV